MNIKESWIEKKLMIRKNKNYNFANSSWFGKKEKEKIKKKERKKQREKQKKAKNHIKKERSCSSKTLKRMAQKNQTWRSVSAAVAKMSITGVTAPNRVWGGPLGRRKTFFCNIWIIEKDSFPNTPQGPKPGYLRPSNLQNRINLPLAWFCSWFEMVLCLTMLTG